MDLYDVALQLRSEMLLIWNQARCERSKILITFTPHSAKTQISMKELA